MNRTYCFLMIGLALLFTPRIAAQVDDFPAIGTVHGATPCGRPAVVEGHGLVVPLRIIHSGNSRRGVYDDELALWFVETGEVEVVEPLDEETPWYPEVLLNRHGELFISPTAGFGDEGFILRSRHKLYRRNIEGDVVLYVEEVTRECLWQAVNASGAVVGFFIRPNQQWRRAAVTGDDIRMQNMPGREEGWRFSSAWAVNDEGVVVGSALAAPADEAVRYASPAIWLAPDDIVLFGQDTFPNGGTAADINADGLVLIQSLVIVEREHTALAARWHTWKLDEGLEEVPHPEGKNVSVAALSDRGEVLLRVADPARRAGSGGYWREGYLVREGRLYHLPDVPGAIPGTYDYRYISPEGYIVGSASFEGETPRDRTPRCFVLPPDLELELAQ